MDTPVSTAYPKWQYHASEPARLVNNAEEEKALGPGWVDNPAIAGNAKPTAKKEEAEDKTEKKAARAGS